MTHQSQVHFPNMPAATGRQIAQLRHVLRLVEQIAGRAPTADDDDESLDESARFSSAYNDALPIVQRRFDAIAGDASAWAAAGVEALLVAGGDGRRPTAAARRLANELVNVLRELRSVLSL